MNTLNTEYVFGADNQNYPEHSPIVEYLSGIRQWTQISGNELGHLLMKEGN